MNTYTASGITNAPIAARVSDVWAGPTSAARTLAAAPAVGTVAARARATPACRTAPS